MDESIGSLFRTLAIMLVTISVVVLFGLVMRDGLDSFRSSLITQVEQYDAGDSIQPANKTQKGIPEPVVITKEVVKEVFVEKEVNHGTNWTLIFVSTIIVLGACVGIFVFRANARDAMEDERFRLALTRKPPQKSSRTVGAFISSK